MLYRRGDFLNGLRHLLTCQILQLSKNSGCISLRKARQLLNSGSSYVKLMINES